MPWVASRWSPQEEGGEVQKDVAPESALVRPSVMMGGRTGEMFGRRRLWMKVEISGGILAWSLSSFSSACGVLKGER
jgi:hypothetical protein